MQWFFGTTEGGCENTPLVVPGSARSWRRWTSSRFPRSALFSTAALSLGHDRRKILRFHITHNPCRSPKLHTGRISPDVTLLCRDTANLGCLCCPGHAADCKGVQAVTKFWRVITISDQIRSREVFVERCEDRAIRISQLAQATIGNLPRPSDPPDKMRNIVFVRNECETRGARFLKMQQQCAGLRDRSLAGALGQHATDPSSVIEQLANCGDFNRLHPRSKARMEFVIHKPEGDQSN